MSVQKIVKVGCFDNKFNLKNKIILEKVKLMQNLYKMKTQCVTFGLVQRNSEKALRGLLLKVHMKVKGVHFTPFIENMK